MMRKAGMRQRRESVLGRDGRQTFWHSRGLEIGDCFSAEMLIVHESRLLIGSNAHSRCKQKE